MGDALDHRAMRMAPRFARTALPVATVVVVQMALFPVPLGIWVQGLVLGLLGSLMAVGLALVYRLNKIINFAQGDLGTAPAVLAIGLVGLSGVEYFVGLLTGVVATVILCAVVNVVLIRRFTRAPRLVLTVVTIGLAQALVVASLLIPRIWGQTPIATAVVSFPWHLALRLSPAVFDANDLVAIVVSLACLASVAVWLKRSRVGIAVRATGDRRDRAAMLGIPVNRLQTVTWVVAGLLSFASVFFKGAVVRGLPLDPTFSLTSLSTALAALALGGFDNLPVVGISAVALGVLEQGVSWNQPTNPTLVLAVVAAVVLLAVLARQFVAGRPTQEVGGWTLSGALRDVPPHLRRLPEWRVGAPLGALTLVVAAFTVPLWADPGTLIELATLVVLAIVGCSIVVLAGWTGQVSLAQMSFAAVGAAVGALALLDWHWDLSLALLLGGAAGAAAAAVVGIPTLRLDGVFVAVTTLAFGLAVSGYFLDRAEFSWIPSGALATAPPRLFGMALSSEASIFDVCLAVGVLVLVGLRGLRHSRSGRVLRVVQSDHRTASSYGIAVARARLAGFAISGFIAGVAGCLLLVVNQQYTEAPFDVSASLAVFTATVVGGVGSPLGAVLGAGLVEGSAVFLPPSWQLFPSAAGVLLVLLAFPGGVAALWCAGRDKLAERLARRGARRVGQGGIPAGAGHDAAGRITPDVVAVTDGGHAVVTK